ncbi:DUF4402 domain-containing protein [Marinobacterium arenosum]|uniref:DUF4402 domain-containing protein n=1 Tax=Marinobacterium arenosum TaxID=2862496 RepID=UPI001C988CC3|nr:DUF4402 domain-containing protein [Marinobacterium arenosum]MBY4676497.1 DUF4402 domain-containing protein [Marinobacterium arenosum]
MRFGKELATSILFCSALTSAPAWALDFNATANVIVTTALSSAEVAQVDFGTIEASNGATCAMDPTAGNALTGTSCTAGTGTLGDYTLTGAAGANLLVTVNAPAAAVNDITYTPTWNNGGALVAAGVQGTMANPTGTTTLNIGGTLTNGAAVTPGNTSFTFNVNVVYQ